MATKNPREKFDESVDKVIHERGDGAGPAQYVHEVDQPDAFKPEVEVRDTEDPNITSEVHVVVDKVIPLVTQDDPAGYGQLELPIHAFVGGTTVEERFKEEAGEQVEVSDAEREKAVSEGGTAREAGVKKSGGDK